MVGREVPFASALFYVRPLMYSHMQAATGGQAQTSSFSLHKLVTNASCGLLTAMLVTPISQAPSVVAAYQQGHGERLEEAVLHIKQRYGWKGFFRGMGARTFSLAGTFTVVPLALEALERVLKPE